MNESAIDVAWHAAEEIHGVSRHAVKVAIEAYERARLEAGWRMCPREPTELMAAVASLSGGDWKLIWASVPSPEEA